MFKQGSLSQFLLVAAVLGIGWFIVPTGAIDDPIAEQIRSVAVAKVLEGRVLPSGLRLRKDSLYISVNKTSSAEKKEAYVLSVEGRVPNDRDRQDVINALQAVKWAELGVKQTVEIQFGLLLADSANEDQHFEVLSQYLKEAAGIPGVTLRLVSSTNGKRVVIASGSVPEPPRAVNAFEAAVNHLKNLQVWPTGWSFDFSGLRKDDKPDPLLAIRAAVKQLIGDNSGVWFRAESLPNKKVVVELLPEDSIVPDRNAVDQAAERVKAAGIENVIITTPRLPVETPVNEIWPVNLLAGQGAVDGGVVGAVSAVSGVLNAVFGKTDNPVIRSDNLNLWITAPRRTAQKIRAHLAFLDTRPPQVQIDMWSIHLSGSQKDVSARGVQIARDLQLSRDLMGDMPGILSRTIARHASKLRKDQNVVQLFRILFGPNPHEEAFWPEEMHFSRRYSLLEGLILIAVADKRQDIAKAFARDVDMAVATMLGCDASTCKANDGPNPDTLTKAQRVRLAALHGKESCPLNAGGDRRPRSFPRLRLLLDEQSLSMDQGSVNEFLAALADYNAFAKGLGMLPDGACFRSKIDSLDDVPQRLARSATALDRALAALVDNYALDVQAMFLQPLLEEIQSSRGNRTGVEVAGKVRVVVSSHRPATIAASMQSFADVTRPAPFNVSDILSKVFPGSLTTSSETGGGTEQASGTKEETTSESGQETPKTSSSSESKSSSSVKESRKFLETLPDLAMRLSRFEYALVLAALQNDVAPVFQKLAPGVSFTITPSVSLDGSAADLAFTATFSQATTAPDTKERTDLWRSPEPDAITSHTVTTRTIVPGQDLFGISSFSIDTSMPQGMAYVPILGRLPIIGNAFQFPKPNRKVHHENIIAVNATIIPSALGLTGFYGANRGGELVYRLATEHKASTPFVKSMHLVP